MKPAVNNVPHQWRWRRREKVYYLWHGSPLVVPNHARYWLKAEHVVLWWDCSGAMEAHGAGKRAVILEMLEAARFEVKERPARQRLAQGRAMIADLSRIEE